MSADFVTGGAFKWLRWIHSNRRLLQHYESAVLSRLRTPFKHELFEIRPGVSINTLQTLTSGSPVLLCHGWGGGLGFWVHNIDELAARHQVFAIDWLGFGRSSNPSYHGTCIEDAEDWWVESIEDWRKAQSLGKLNIVGHSMGGFLGISYALKYPENVDKMVILSPAGIPRRGSPVNFDEVSATQMPLKFFLFANIISAVSPQVLFRVLGPIGKGILINYCERKFGDTMSREFKEYVYLLNTSTWLTGSMAAQHVLPTVWTKPVLDERVKKLKTESVFVWGEDDYTDMRPIVNILRKSPHRNLFSFHKKRDSGHHIYWTDSEYFNNLVLETFSCG